MEEVETSENKTPYRNSLLSCSTLTGFNVGSSPAGVIKYTCENCQRQFSIGYGRKNRFCSRSCCASFNAKKTKFDDKRYEQLAEAKKHIKKHFAQIDVKCKRCGMIFKNIGTLANHIRWVHKEGHSEIRLHSSKKTSDNKKSFGFVSSVELRDLTEVIT